jgi:membrane-bound lytic murein transglycosylase A
MPVPDPRPSEKIAKLFPQVDTKNAAGAAEAAKKVTPALAQPATAAAQPSTTSSAAPAVPLPEARPNIEPGRTGRRYHYHYFHHHRYRRSR